jgi:hypothetical protein
MIFSGPSACCASADYTVTYWIVGAVVVVVAVIFLRDTLRRCR